MRIEIVADLEDDCGADHSRKKRKKVKDERAREGREKESKKVLHKHRVKSLCGDHMWLSKLKSSNNKSQHLLNTHHMPGRM